LKKNSKNLVFKYLAEKILEIQKETPVLVAIDGVDAAGKTRFSSSLTDEFSKYNRQVVSASVDDFHNPASIRYIKGKDSPEGFYYDSFNYPLLKEDLLNPFLSGQGKYRIKVFDHISNREIIEPARPVEKSAILVMEGIFLLRRELVDYWDFKIFLDVEFKITLQRNIQRVREDYQEMPVAEITERFNRRYKPGQEIYFKEADPKSQADIIIDNRDFAAPEIIDGTIIKGFKKG
jgi:uridine kinase